MHFCILNSPKNTCLVRVGRYFFVGREDEWTNSGRCVVDCGWGVDVGDKNLQILDL